jgi:glc operon protein GlcG
MLKSSTLWFAGTAAILACAFDARAQAPAPVPEAMPYDIPYGTPIDLATAQKAIMGAEAEAKKHNWKIAISVVDTHGELVAHATIDGTLYASIGYAQAKARTAARLKRPSKVLADAVNGGSPSTLSLTIVDHDAAAEGGFPILIDGKVIGAIGASGGLGAQDAVVAKAGLDAVTH